MIGWILFFGLLTFNFGFVAGALFASRKKITQEQEKRFGDVPLENDENSKESREQKRIFEDIKFMINFNGENEGENDE